MKNYIKNYSPSYLNDLLEVVQALDSYVGEIRGKNILVTGGTGFLGHWLVDGLNLMGARVTVLTRNPEAALKRVPYWKEIDGLSWLKSDLTESIHLDHGYDYLIHAANDLAYSSSEGLKAARTVLDCAERAGVKKVLFLSPGAAYSTAGGNEYAKAKILIEQEGVRRSSAGKFDFLIARCFSFVGPFQDLEAHYAAPQFFKAVIEGRPIVIQGNGLPIRSFLYPSDFVVGALKVLLSGKSAEIYDLGSDEAVEIRHLAQLINEHREGFVPEVQLLNLETVSLSQSLKYLPDLNRMRDELGFNPKISLNEAIIRTARFYQEVMPNSKIRVCTR